MSQMLALVIIVAILFAGDVVSTKTKAWVPSVFISAVLFLIGYAIDNVITFIAVAKLDYKLRELKEALEEKKESLTKTVSLYREEAIEKIKSYVPESSAYKALTKALSMQNKRIIRAFPRLKSIKYNDALPELREFINRKK